MKKDKREFEEEITLEDSNVDEDLENLYRELENENFTSSSDETLEEDVSQEDNEDIQDETKSEEPEEVNEPDEEFEEVLESTPSIEEEVKTVEEDEKPTEETKKDEKPKKKIKWQAIFNVLSIIFIVGCLIFYGTRAVKYYKIFNPKSEDGKALVFLGTQIKDDNPVVSEGDGVYSIDGEYVFKGTEINNYVRYSNLLWRIVKVNQDNSVLLVTDEIINNLVWNNEIDEFSKSNIHEWLNETKDVELSGVFSKVLNDKGQYLNEMTVCADQVDDLKNITCKDRQEIGYVGLLSITDYANSVNENSYINNTENIWLYNTSKDKVWNVTEGNITSSDPTSGYGVKPVITIRPNTSVLSGNGTLEDPYTIESGSNSKLGKKVLFGEDKWIVYEETSDTLRLILDDLYDDGNTTYKFSKNSSVFNPDEPYSLAYHLNNTILKSFNYNDKLVDCDWYIGAYKNDEGYDYKNIYDTKLTAKIGLYNVSDLKFNNELTDYFYLTADGNDKVFGYSNNTNLYSMKYSYMKSVRPAICIENKNLTGTGSDEDPYKVGE